MSRIKSIALAATSTLTLVMACNTSFATSPMMSEIESLEARISQDISRNPRLKNFSTEPSAVDIPGYLDQYPLRNPETVLGMMDERRRWCSNILTQLEYAKMHASDLIDSGLPHEANAHLVLKLIEAASKLPDYDFYLTPHTFVAMTQGANMAREAYQALKNKRPNCNPCGSSIAEEMMDGRRPGIYEPRLSVGQPAVLNSLVLSIYNQIEWAYYNLDDDYYTQMVEYRRSRHCYGFRCNPDPYWDLPFDLSYFHNTLELAKKQLELQQTYRHYMPHFKARFMLSSATAEAAGQTLTYSIYGPKLPCVISDLFYTSDMALYYSRNASEGAPKRRDVRASQKIDSSIDYHVDRLRAFIRRENYRRKRVCDEYHILPNGGR